MRGPLLQGALVLGVLLASKHGRASAVATEVQNVTLQNTSNELLYIPELCVTSDSDCEGGWYVLSYNNNFFSYIFIYSDLITQGCRRSCGVV